MKRRGEEPLGLGLHPLLRPGEAAGGARRQTVREEDASAGIGPALLSPLYPSLR